MGTLGNILDVFKMLTRGRSSQRYCPRCASVHVDLSGCSDSWMAPKRFTCEDCGWTGSIVMELEKEEHSGSRVHSKS